MYNTGEIKIEKKNTTGILELDILEIDDSIAINKGDINVIHIKLEDGASKEDLKAIGMDIIALISIINNNETDKIAKKIAEKHNQSRFKHLRNKDIWWLIKLLHLE